MASLTTSASSKAAADLESLNSIGRENVIRHQQQIVIVDDESTGRTILGKIAQQVSDNIKVIEFNNPITVLDWLDSNQPDLIITDYRMPELNGVDFIKKIREKQSCQHIPIMMITVVSEKAVRYEALEAGATAFLTRPIDQIECRTSCRNLLKLHEQNLIIQDRADWLSKQVEAATEKIVQREKETLLRLAKAGEYRDEETGNHVVRMAKYSRQIAEELGLSEEDCDYIEYAAPMHDIGKIGVPDHILLKPGKLDEEEWKVMKCHTNIGYEILSDSQSKYMQMGAIIALCHHEWFDGSGYPNGMKGKDIPLIARIVSVADVYDALISVRPYKKAWSISDAVAYLKKQAGTQLDPECVEAFCRRRPQIAIIQSDYADNRLLEELNKTAEDLLDN